MHSQEKMAPYRLGTVVRAEIEQTSVKRSRQRNRNKEHERGVRGDGKKQNFKIPE